MVTWSEVLARHYTAEFKHIRWSLSLLAAVASPEKVMEDKVKFMKAYLDGKYTVVDKIGD